MSQTSNDDRIDIGHLQFEWYPPKALSNFKKHKVSFEHAQTIFGDKFMLDVPDRENSEEEARFIGIGRAISNQILFVVFTEIEDRIRIISARLAEPWERREYEIASGYEGR